MTTAEPTTVQTVEETPALTGRDYFYSLPVRPSFPERAETSRGMIADWLVSKGYQISDIGKDGNFSLRREIGLDGVSPPERYPAVNIGLRVYFSIDNMVQVEARILYWDDNLLGIEGHIRSYDTELFIEDWTRFDEFEQRVIRAVRTLAGIDVQVAPPSSPDLLPQNSFLVGVDQAGRVTRIVRVSDTP